MKIRSVTVMVLALLLSCNMQAQDGLVKIKSVNSVEESVAKLSTILTEKGMRIFSSIDHQQGATNVDLDLRSTSLVIFGNPKVGTKLMQCDQRVGVDLPLKILIWQDEEGIVWIGYRNPLLLANNYNLEGCKEVLQKVKKAMAIFAKEAAS